MSEALLGFLGFSLRLEPAALYLDVDPCFVK